MHTGTWLALGALAVLGIGYTLGNRVRSEGFDYRGIRVEMTGDESGWVWSANPIGWAEQKEKGFWEWLQWPMISEPGALFPTSQSAALDAVRAIDEVVPFS